MSKEVCFTPTYAIGDMVYITHDPSQSGFMVIGYEVNYKGYLYRLQCGDMLMNAYPFEVSAAKNVMML